MNHISLMANVDIGGSVILGEGIFIGTKATIIPKKRISSGIVIGAGTAGCGCAQPAATG